MKTLRKLFVLTLITVLFAGTIGTTASAEEKQSIGRFKLTAYCSCYSCSGKWGTKTASGNRARSGRTVAVDPSEIKLGTKLLINGEVYIAEDTGSAVKGNVIDIYFDSHSEVSNFGVKRDVQVYKY